MPTLKPSQFAALETASKVGDAALSKINAKAVSGAEENKSATLLYGEWDTGKTYFLIEAILRGLNVFFLNTDMGRNGLRTIREELGRTGHFDLFEKHVRSWDVNDYSLVSAHLVSDFFEKQLAPWTPDIDCWDGFTSFQIVNVDEHVLAMESKEMKNNELREAGLHAGQQDWGAIKRATMRPVSMWMNKTWGGKKVHKVVTCAEQEWEDESGFGKITRVRPYLQGAAAKVICAPFDLVLRTTRRKVDGKLQHCYTTRDESGKVFTKRRGMDLVDDGAADPVAAWDQLLGT